MPRKRIQICLDEGLLRAVDRAARAAGVRRSALVREALISYLRSGELREKEHEDRAGYRRRPENGADLGVWEAAAAWPDE